MMLKSSPVAQQGARASGRSTPALHNSREAVARSFPCMSVTRSNELVVASMAPSASRRQVVVHAAPTTVTVTKLPALLPLDDDYERYHSFGDFANWLIPGHVMLGRYPYCERSRCTSRDKGEAQLEKIIETGITTFVCLQGELPPQADLPLGGKGGFIPYKPVAELIKSAYSPPPSMEVMMNLRNPTLNKFLPPKRNKSTPAAPAEEKPSYTLDFLHFPITDLSIPSAEALLPFLEDLVNRIEQGEKLYIHCWGGRGRAGTVGACLLALAYGIDSEEALARVQRAFATRQDTGYKSPETQEQFQFVRSFISQLPKRA